MDIKLIKSKINLVQAQLAQLTGSGLFSENEVSRLSVSYMQQLARWESELSRAEEIEVNDHEELS